MNETKKIVLFRLLAILLLLIPFGFSIWFLICYCQNYTSNLIIHIFATGVMLLFLVFQLVMLIKNIKKPLIIHDIAFNENKTVNHTATIFVTVGELIALAATIATAVLVFQQTEIANQMTVMLILSIFVFMLMNCSIFLLYIPVFKEKKFDVRDLLK